MGALTARRWSRDHAGTHPSARIREARDFAEAVRFLRDAVEFEAVVFGELDDYSGRAPGSTAREHPGECDAALAIWGEEQRAAVGRATARMRAAGLDQFAEAAEGDFAALEF